MNINTCADRCLIPLRHFMLSLVLLAPSIALAQVGLTPVELRLFNLANQERKTARLSRLKWDYHLAEVARAHAAMMAKHAQLSYGFPGETPLIQRIAASGVRFNAASDAASSGTNADEAHGAFMNSPVLRARLLGNRYDSVGLAAVERGRRFYVAWVFAHVLPPYTETQFRETVVRAFNDARRNADIPPIDTRPDERLIRVACSKDRDAGKALADLPGATDIVIYSSSEPQNLPTRMQQEAGDKALHRMNIGVCFPDHGRAGYSVFWVVASFYPVS